MKKLVIVAHPTFDNSVINKKWAEKAVEIGGDVNVHHLYGNYPDLAFDVEKEQELLLAHDTIIFQFPINWFSAPFALKKWMDEVLTYGWAFGPGGDKIQGKKIKFATSTGGAEDAYTNGITIDALLSSYTTSFKFCGSDVADDIHVFYGANANPSEDAVAQNIEAYGQFILS